MRISTVLTGLAVSCQGTVQVLAGFDMSRYRDLSPLWRLSSFKVGILLGSIGLSNCSPLDKRQETINQKISTN